MGFILSRCTETIDNLYTDEKKVCVEEKANENNRGVKNGTNQL